MQQVAEPWLILNLTGSSVLLGLDSFAADAAVWVLTLIGGVIADRRDRKLVIYLFQGIQMFCPAIVVLLLLTGHVTAWLVILLSFVVGATDALSTPALQSIVPSTVEASQIEAAVSLNSTQFNLSRVLGPMTGGLVMAGIGAVGCFALNTLTYIPLFLAIAVLPRKLREVNGPKVVQVKGVSIRGRFSKMITSRNLRSAMLTVVISTLFCNPLLTFAPVLIRDVFKSNAIGFGQALSAFGGGGLIAAFLVFLTKDKIDRRLLCSLAAAANGLLLIAVAFNSWFWLLIPLLVGAGCAMTACQITASTILQSHVGNDVRGQVTSVYIMLMRGGSAIGSMVVGLATARWGILHVLLVCGISAIFFQALNFSLWKKQTN